MQLAYLSGVLVMKGLVRETGNHTYPGGEGVPVMSQQEFFQGPQFQEQGQPTVEDDEIEYSPQPYYWSTQPGKGAPKDEPASLSDEPMVQADYPGDYQHGYAAQDNVSNPA